MILLTDTFSSSRKGAPDMSWPQLISLSLYQKKKDSVLLKAGGEDRHYMLKCIPSRAGSMCRALHDEALFFENFRHPCVPVYYGIRDDFIIPSSLLPADGSPIYTAVCMEYRSGISLKSFADRSIIPDLVAIVHKTGQTLFALLKAGIVYTDLNPNNILVTQTSSTFDISLLDFTCCYYYKIDPDPVYPLRFSYRLNPSLKGQQLLIQELSFLLLDLTASYTEKEAGQRLPSSLYALLISGCSPSESLTLPDFLESLQQTVI